MVSPRPRRLPLLCLVVATALGCATYSDPALESDDWARETRENAASAARATARGAVVAGEAVGTAYRGVVKGFDEPASGAYGDYPRDYATVIRKHMVRFEGVPANASFRFERPRKGWLNRGILAGGGVAWQGYLVEVEVVEAALFDSQTEPDGYVVRMRDGEIVEVMEAEYADALRWAEPPVRDAGVAARAKD